MLKKFTSGLVCMALIFSSFLSFFSVNAEDISLSYSNIKSFISLFGDKSFDAYSPEQETIMYFIASAFFETDKDIDKLIQVINGELDVSNIDSRLAKLINELSGDAESKTRLLFILNVIKSVKESNRAAAIEKYTAKTQYAGLTATQEAALARIYVELVDSDHIVTLEKDHGINDKMLLTLFSGMSGSFVLTDSASDTSLFDIKSVNSDFASRLKSNISSMDIDRINGTSISTGEAIVRAAVRLINNGVHKDTIKDYKTVLGAIGMYEEYVAPSPSPSPSGGGGGGGGGGASRPNPGIGGTVVTPTPDGSTTIPAPVINENNLDDLESFTDVDRGHWSAPYIAELASRRIMIGDADGTFRPNFGITREEMAVIMIRLLGLEGDLDSATSIGEFIDVDEFASWAEQSIYLADRRGIMIGYDDLTFKPKRIISRQELALVISRSLTKSSADINLPFADNDSIADWSINGVRRVYSLGIVRGYENNTFRPKNDVTRAEVATMLYNFMYVENLL